jgi:predicted metal-dependent HD superfamily phosphohydrolase
MDDDALRTRMADRWHDLARRSGADLTAASDVLHSLLAAYSDPARFYHDLRHIAEVLDVLDAAIVPPPPTLALAAWFHDVVYDSRRQDNEERSVAVAADALARMRVVAPSIDRVAALIRMTRHHQADLGDMDALLFLDADLAILGAPPERYKEYARAIRQEYAWVSDGDYRAGRCAVFQGFLDRPRIFATEAVFQERETAARRNLAEEIAALS